MGTRRHGQEGALALPPLPSGNVVKCFYALVVTAKRSVDELFMHYFYNLSSASGGSAPRFPLGLHHWTPPEDFRSQTPHLPTPGKNHAAKAHYYTRCTELVNRKQLGWK